MPDSRYGSGSSRYCYPDTSILINHYDIKDDRQLQSMENILATQRLSELQDTPVPGDFDLRHLQKIHECIFKDLYPFAGELRSENIRKGGFTFAQAQFIHEAAEEVFTQLIAEDWESMGKEQLARRLAYYMAEINVLHPFREGNGRSLREFIRCLALEAEFIINWAAMPKEVVLQASIESVRDPEQLKKVIFESLTKINK
ncbi:Fic family protein [Halobacillus sp. A5]|uniref:Fic/DOC family protein n=1 Tax=Halobacillus sp. A5 TaxID=2880263 RepID=UPI0020A694B8|nr:Fic family protein [Halobacillus sp. A5]MCP3027308.1 Fic family protein [Halobacillus sp. A5]